MDNIVKHEIQVMQRRFNEANEDNFISEQAMTLWFLSLGSKRELPEPKPDIQYSKIRKD